MIAGSYNIIGVYGIKWNRLDYVVTYQIITQTISGPPILPQLSAISLVKFYYRM